MSVRVEDGKTGKKGTRTVNRRQLPITPAYAFTDYRAQGQTLPAVIVDIAKVPSGTPLNLFNVYVALSRSAGRHSIRLLREYDRSVFRQTHEPELLAEDDRLERLDVASKERWAAYRSRL
ncbi:uncharacterized protein SCHCODRAFT_02579232 [Schizophyllum commune H4-8]|uniref:uncharacterized protein n=1 Tax=Schizophyllum commune (strain H4-8 / FGSC 9210) TaxID=578458 RepID=UPI00215F18FD|nr:uncharacterized protein SCHCODRAFT_02579232 [Schizophyllum commune H4-8]KAI5892662.1 hypothetical protein SCHCODRAFT_02579232 [Schizophyllum commune H4-8]